LSSSPEFVGPPHGVGIHATAIGDVQSNDATEFGEADCCPWASPTDNSESIGGIEYDGRQ